MGKQLSLEQASAYLHLEALEVSRLVRRREIPFFGEIGRPFFREEELDAWASQRILGMNERKLDSYNRDFEVAHSRDAMPFRLSSLLTPERIILGFQAKTKASVLSETVAHADALGLLYDPSDLLESLRNREELCSTGLAGGFAILHPRNHDPYLATESFLLFARSERPIPFGAPDGKSTDLFFTLVCHEDRIHLRALARLCMALSDADLVEILRRSEDSEEIFAAFSNLC